MIKLIGGIILYLVTLITFLFGSWLFSLTTVLIFSLYYNAVILIPLAIVLDGYFGNFYAVPWLSLGSIIWFLLVEELKPRLRNF